MLPTPTPSSDQPQDVALGGLGNGNVLSVSIGWHLAERTSLAKRNLTGLVPSAVTQQGGVRHVRRCVHLAETELAFQSVTGKEIQARRLGVGT